MLDLRIKKPKLYLPSIKLFNFYLYTVVFFIIFSSGAILDQKYFNFSQILLIFLCSVFLLRVINKKYIALAGIIFPVYILVNYVNYSPTIVNYLLFLIKLSLIFIFVRYCILKQIDILKMLNNVVVGICIYSLFTYVFLDVMHVISPSHVEVINNKPYKIYFGLHYHWQDLNWFSWRVSRNNSIFWEPGVFQIYISYAIFFQLFLAKKANKKVMALLIFSIFTTFSTTGTMLTLVILVIKFVSLKSKKLLSMLMKVYLFPVLLIGGIYVGTSVFNQKANNGSASYDLRADDLGVGLHLFYKKPFFGWGFLNNSGFEAITGFSTNSNGFVSLLFQQGVFGFIILCIPILIISIRLIKIKDFFTALAFTLFYFVSAATEPLMYANFFNIFVSMGILLFIENKFPILHSKNKVSKPNNIKFRNKVA